MFAASAARGVFMAGMQEQGIPVFMEADDNYFVGPPVNLGTWGTRYDPRLFGGNHTYEGFRRFLEWVDGVIVSTPFLADLFGRHNENVHVCPNSVDPGDWPDDPPHQPDGVLRIGWAASDSHAFDAALIRRALDWASRQPDTRVVIMGIKPELTGFRFDYEYVPWTDSLAEYRRTLSKIDLMLCPLRPGFWADGKSDLKALEAAMAYAAPVVSHVEAYRPWWDRTYTCKTEKDFLKIVKHLVRNRDEVLDLASSAREYVLDERDIRKTVSKWRKAIGV
jgi:hypothetical protein